MRIARQHYVALRSGQQSRFLWARVEVHERQMKKKMTAKKRDGTKDTPTFQAGERPLMPTYWLMTGRDVLLQNYADAARQHATSSASSSTLLPIPPKQQTKAPGLPSGASPPSMTTSASASAPNPQSPPPTQEPPTATRRQGKVPRKRGTRHVASHVRTL